MKLWEEIKFAMDWEINGEWENGDAGSTLLFMEVLLRLKGNEPKYLEGYWTVEKIRVGEVMNTYGLIMEA